MYALKNEHQHESIGERWAALDEYFVCITECDLNDQTCITRCLVTHLKIDDGTEANMDEQTLALITLRKEDLISSKKYGCCNQLNVGESNEC